MESISRLAKTIRPRSAYPHSELRASSAQQQPQNFISPEEIDTVAQQFRTRKIG